MVPWVGFLPWIPGTTFCTTWRHLTSQGWDPGVPGIFQWQEAETFSNCLQAKGGIFRIDSGVPIVAPKETKQSQAPPVGPRYFLFWCMLSVCPSVCLYHRPLAMSLCFCLCGSALFLCLSPATSVAVFPCLCLYLSLSGAPPLSWGLDRVRQARSLGHNI